MELTGWIKYAAKAVYAGTMTFFMELITALTDGEVTQVEWLIIVLGVITVTGGVFGLNNEPHPDVQS